MSEKQYISFTEYERYLIDLSKKITADPLYNSISHIHGVPRGGLPIAVYLSHQFNLPYIHNLDDFNLTNKSKLLIVDDIVDSGKTIDKYKKIDVDNNFLYAVLHYKIHSLHQPTWFVERTDNWIVYPYELDSEKPSPIHINMYPKLFKGI